MTKTRIYTILSMLLLAFIATAQSVTLQVAQQVAEGNKFQLTVKINNIDAEPPQSIKLPNCTLIYGPALSSGMSFTSVNGKSSSVTFINASYTYRADKASTITIPAITVTDSDGKKYSTKPTKLTILPAGQRPQNSRPQPDYDMDEAAEGSRVNPQGHFSADDMFVRINVDKTNVYEQEPVVATIKLYTHQSIRTFQMLTQPTFEGFLSEELDVNEPMGTETINGKEYRTAVLKRCILYPQKAGKLKLSSGTYQVVLVDRVNVNSGSFIPDFRLVEKQINTPEQIATINVAELPEPRPASFDGAVGDYTATIDLSSVNLHTNEPATYTYKITGTGNIKYLKTPDITMPAGIDMYTPKTDIDANYSRGDISGTYTVTYTLVPQEVGTFEIPAVPFTYFNPRTRQYHTIDLQGYTVKVAKGIGGPAVEQQTISKGMTDILHIKTNHQRQVHTVHYIYHSVWYWMLYIIMTLTLISVIIIYRRQLRLNADVRGRQLARALRKAMKRFKTAKAAMDVHDSEKFYAEISKALWGYLSDKLGIPSSQLLRDNIAAQLEAYGANAASIDNVIAILDQCEMARFTPMNTDADMAQLYDKVVNTVKSLENIVILKK